MPTTRTAHVKGNGVNLDRVAAFMPRNYEVWGWDDTGTAVVIKGTDNAGWTLDDYVLPRLASGCMFGTEVFPDPAVHYYLDDSGLTMRWEELTEADREIANRVINHLASTANDTTDAWSSSKAAMSRAARLDALGEL